MNLLRALRGLDGPAVLVTLVQAPASSPRSPGAHMLVTTEHAAGTVGGGEVERHAVQVARSLLGRGGDEPCVEWSRFEEGEDRLFTLQHLLVRPGTGPWAAAAERTDGHPHAECVCVSLPDDPGVMLVGAAWAEGDPHGAAWGADTRMWAVETARGLLNDDRALVSLRHCPRAAGGGEFFFDIVRPPDLQVAVFGAGHVGRALVTVLSVLPCDALWIDDRRELLSEIPGENVEPLFAPDPPGVVSGLPEGCFCVVATHSHDLDREVCGRLLGRDDVRFVGLLGSHRKRTSFEQHWSGQGMPAGRFARLVCPVGAEQIQGREPGVIAVAIAAQILQVRRAVYAR